MLLTVFGEICDEIGVGMEKRTLNFENGTFLRLSEEVQWKITGLQGEFGLRESISEMVIDGGHIIDYVLKNVLSGEIQMLNKYDVNDHLRK